LTNCCCYCRSWPHSDDDGEEEAGRQREPAVVAGVAAATAM